MAEKNGAELGNNSQKDYKRSLSEDLELQEYIQAFTSSSSRVSWVMIILMFITIVFFTGYWNSRENSWTLSRLKLAQIAYRIKQYEGVAQPSEVISQEDILRAKRWLKKNNFTEEDLKNRVKYFEEIVKENILLLKVPVLDLTFDINDLGALSGVTFMILLLWLLYSLNRKSENLNLSTWKIVELFKQDSVVDRGSKSNFLYHALAMAQVFNSPPTLTYILNREGLDWCIRRFLRFTTVVLFFIPIVVQLAVFHHDFNTFDRAKILNEETACLSFWIQIVTLAINSLLFVGCVLFSINMARTWDSTFKKINSSSQSTGNLAWMQGANKSGGSVK